MIRVRRRWTLVVLSLALSLLFASQSHAQLGDAQRLEKQATALYRAGRYNEAIPLARQALALYEKALGPDDPDLAHVAYDLAGLYYNVGRYAEAEPLYTRAMAIWEREQGPLSSGVALVAGQLAEMYDYEGRFADAETLHQKLLTINEKIRGPDHPEVARAAFELAGSYEAEGRYGEAEPLFRRAAAILEKAFGPDAPNLGAVLNSLESVYMHEGRYSTAEPIAKRALALVEKVSGANSADFGSALNNLGLLYKYEGRSVDAEALYRRALAIAEATMRPNDPRIAIPLMNLAEIYRDDTQYAKAEPLYQRALAIRMKSLGPEHTNTADSLHELADSYRAQGRYAEAEAMDKRALAIWQKALGPNHRNVARVLSNLGDIYSGEKRYADAEAAFRQALTIREKIFYAGHPELDESLNKLAQFYGSQQRYADAIPLVQRAIADKAATAATVLPVLFAAQSSGLIDAATAEDDGLNVVERALHTAAGQALNALELRFAAGSDRLAELVRKDQDLTGEAAALDKSLLAIVSKPPSQQDRTIEQSIRDRIAAIGRQRDDLAELFAREFPNYSALSRPAPLTVKDIQSLLADDDALVVIDLGDAKSYVWVIARRAAAWKELAATAGEVSEAVTALRRQLDPRAAEPFDTQASFALYQRILSSVEDLLRDKSRLSFVLNGALTSLPPQLLVTRDPSGKPLSQVDWLVRGHALTILPSIASLKVLRGNATIGSAAKPLIGFADPLFNRGSERLAENNQVVAEVTATRGIRGTVADLGQLRTALRALPETANELRAVAANVKADPADIILGSEATETRVKREKLDQYRIIYFATHGLLAGDVAYFAKLNAEPALVLSLPEHPTEFDDGLLTASEVAQLKLNADWVVLSACNTAAADKPGAEALSGLARAFFYAGARSLVVSNWEVESESAVALMSGTFAALANNPKLSHAEALRSSMLAMLGDAAHPQLADPKYWAPFVVVGEPAKPAK